MSAALQRTSTINMRWGSFALLLVATFCSAHRTSEEAPRTLHKAPAGSGGAQAGVYLKAPRAAASDPAAAGVPPSKPQKPKGKHPTEAQLDAAQEMAHASQQATFSTPLVKWQKPRPPYQEPKKARAKRRVIAPKQKRAKVSVKINMSTIQVPALVKRVLQRSKRRPGVRKKLIRRVMAKIKKPRFLQKSSKASSTKPCDGVHCSRRGDAMIQKVLVQKKPCKGKAKLISKIMKRKPCKKGAACNQKKAGGLVKGVVTSAEKSIDKVMARKKKHGAGEKLIRRVMKKKPCSKAEPGVPCSQARRTRKHIVRMLLRRSKTKLIRKALQKRKKKHGAGEESALKL